MELNKIYHENCLTGLKKLADKSIDCCVTSPPYFGLRDYGTATWEGGDVDCDHKKPNAEFGHIASSTLEGGKATNAAQVGGYKNECGKCGAIRIDNQIGLEDTPEKYVENLVDVFREVKRVLKDDATLWLNLGDSYASNGERSNNNGSGKSTMGWPGQSKETLNKAEGLRMPAIKHGLKPKDLIGIPWMVAFALRADGWYLRSEIIWAKAISGEINIGTTMPESVQDRPTKSHETIFLLSKSQKYYYDIDAIRQELLFNRYSLSNKNGSSGKDIKGNSPGQTPQGFVRNGHSGYYDGNGNPLFNEAGKNKRTVWYHVPANYPEAHFATFPEQLITDCIKAGSKEGGIILDPFMGAGTTALVARKLDRNYIGFELNGKYIQIAEKRLRDHLGMFI